MKKPLLLLLSVLVVASVATVASAHLTTMLDAVKVSSATDGFIADFRLAQSEAAGRNSAVVLCKSADGATCALRGDWGQGWIVFQDANGNGVREKTEALIVHEHRFASGLRVAGSLNAVRSVTFAPAALPRFNGTALAGGSLTVCHQSARANEGRKITLTTHGAPQAQRQMLERCA
jgi:type IV fimbrial biogenesis protein FimT